MEEVWKPLRFDDLRLTHEVSSLGRIRRAAPGKGTYIGRIFKTSKGATGYYYATFGKNDRIYIHRAVAAVFLGPCPAGFEVNHKNGIKADNRAANLEYLTRRDNVHHAIDHGLFRTFEHHGEKNPAAKLTADDVIHIRSMAGRIARKDIAAVYGVSTSLIDRIHNRQNWTHL